MSSLSTGDKLRLEGRFLSDQNLAWGSSGNLSARESQETFLLTASGTWLGELQPGDLVSCRVADGGWDGSRKPSKELPMHRAIYQRRPEAGWILHVSPPAATVFACQHRAPAADLFIEGMAYLGEIAWVDYFHPGTPALGDAVGKAAEKGSILLMKNHGVIVFDEDLMEARMKLLTLEFACRLQLDAEASGQPLRPLPSDVVEDFRRRRVYRPVPSGRATT